MNNFVIFANGNMSPQNFNFLPETTVIAADGGIHHCLDLGITPHVVIGDFDSAGNDSLSMLENKGTLLIQYPTEKNETDLELAINYAIEKGAIDITLYGLLGGRWDMSLANIILLASPDYDAVNFRVIDGASDIFIVRGGRSLTLYGNPGDTVSVIPLSPLPTGITYSGLAWSLENASLPFGSPRGVSNYLKKEKATIKLDSGVILVYLSPTPSSDG
jgi:thiamine pyrophosphokinase